MNKKKYGQFYTTHNPFNTTPFYKWVKEANLTDDSLVLEPFAGTNNIPLLLNQLNFNFLWDCYDITHHVDKNNNVVNHFNKFEIKLQDTIVNFPKTTNVVITNPPYLAKNTATKHNIKTNFGGYDDLYKYCLKVMLDQVEYVAAILPESFLTCKNYELKTRIAYYVRLEKKMFDDTDTPIALVLFSPKTSNNFEIWSGNRFIGTPKQLKQWVEHPKKLLDLNFNNLDGEIYLNCIDNTHTKSIYFDLTVNHLDKKVDIKNTSRHKTFIKLPKDVVFLDNELITFVEELNNYLKEYREKTFDVFLSVFKGLRKDNLYRRRLSFKEARRIISLVYEQMSKKV